MSTCNAAEIAEKRRLALEKLKAKKSSILQQAPKLTTAAAAASTTSNNQKPAFQPVNSFYKQPTTASISTENKASVFINALKQGIASTHRQELRNSVHPYQRPNVNNGGTDYASKPKQPILGLTPPMQVAAVFNKSINCSVYLISAKRFAAKASGYHEPLINVFKMMPSKAYDNEKRLWTFDLDDYELLQKHASELKPHVIMDEIPRCVISMCLKPPVELDMSCLQSIEETLADKLMPFQKEGVCFGIAQRGRIMICDEMGLGKTYQALAIADFYRDNWPLLICTTASTRESWSSHVRKLLPSVPLHYIQELTNKTQYFGDVRVLVTSYNLMDKVEPKLKERNFGVLIFDESHMLKSHKAKCTDVAIRLAKQAKRVILLSGTPALSRPNELFTQIKMVDPKFMGYMEFGKRYCDAKQTSYGWDTSGQSNLQELNVILKLRYMIRRTKTEVLPDLAEKHRETVVLDPALVWPSDDAKSSLDEVAKNFSASRGREREDLLLRFYAQTAEIKTRAVCVYIKSLLKENKKFIVFAHHRVMMDAITDCLVKANAKFIRIDGSTKNDARAEYIKMFQTSPKCKVAVLSLKACNAGITLTAADLIIFAELDWNPSSLAQAESRAHRIGQEKTVTCRYLMAKRTADDYIWNMLKSKQDTLNTAGLFCDNLQDATRATAQTSSYKIDNYFSPNKSRTSDTSLNESTGKLNTSGNLDTSISRPQNTASPKISQFFTPIRRNSKPQATMSITAEPQPSCSNNNVASKNVKDCDMFKDFFDDDADDDAFASLRSQIPSAKKKPEKSNNSTPRTLNSHDDLFDDCDDVDLAAFRTQMIVQENNLNKRKEYDNQRELNTSTEIKSNNNVAGSGSISAFFDEEDDDAFRDLNF